MSYGIVGYSASGTEVFNTTKHLGIVYAGTISVPFANTTVTQGFPEFAGRTGLQFVSTNRYSNIACSWSYPSGVPTITITRTTTQWEPSATSFVFAFVR